MVTTATAPPGLWVKVVQGAAILRAPLLRQAMQNRVRPKLQTLPRRGRGSTCACDYTTPALIGSDSRCARRYAGCTAGPTVIHSGSWRALSMPTTTSASRRFTRVQTGPLSCRSLARPVLPTTAHASFASRRRSTARRPRRALIGGARKPVVLLLCRPARSSSFLLSSPAEELSVYPRRVRRTHCYSVY